MTIRRFLLCAVLAAGLGGPVAAFQAENRIVVEPLTIDAIQDTGQLSVSARIAVGGEVEIALPFQPGTGFEWQAEPQQDDLLRLMSECESPGEQDRPGSTGKQHFIYRGDSAGSGGITFRYVQPWAPEDAAVTVELTVHVSE